MLTGACDPVRLFLVLGVVSNEFPIRVFRFTLCVGALFYTSSEISCDYDDIAGTVILVRHGLSYFGWIATMLGVVVYAATLHSLGFGNHALLSTVTVFGPVVAWVVAVRQISSSFQTPDL